MRAAAFLALAALATVAQAHFGVFHDTTPETRNYVRAKVAFCNKWVPISAMAMAKAKPVPGTAVERIAFNRMAPPQGITISGNGTVWQYLYNNETCNLSAGIQLHAVFKQNGKPLANYSMTGRTHTQSCAAGAGARFYFNPKGNLSDFGNPLWWYNGVTNKTGAALGNGANDGNITLAGPNAPRSLVIYDDRSTQPFLCCDLIAQGPVNTDWAKKVTTAKGVVACPAGGAGDGDAHAGHKMTAGMNMQGMNMQGHSMHGR